MNFLGLKPFQIIVMAIFGLGAVLGLVFFAGFSGGGGANKQQVGAVVIWGTLPKPAMSTALNELASWKNDYAKVTYVEKGETTFAKELSDALASGTGPDLIIITQEMLHAEKSKLRPIPYASLPKRTFLDTYLPEFELYLDGEGAYGIPLALDPLVLYYNRTMLASAGIASPPATWETVAGLSSAITKRDDSGTVRASLIPFGEYANVRNARAILSLLMLQAGTPITAISGTELRSVIGDSTGDSFKASAAQSAVGFYTEFADPAKLRYSWNRSLPESRSAFLSGDLALYPGFASEAPFIAAANPNLSFDMAPIPVPGTLGSRLTYGLAYALAIPKVSGNPTGAYLAATALAAQEKGNTAKSLSMAPARRAALVPDADDPYETIVYSEALSARGWLSPSPSATDPIFSAMIADIITGRMDVEDAITYASQAITAALR